VVECPPNKYKALSSIPRVCMGGKNPIPISSHSPCPATPDNQSASRLEGFAFEDSPCEWTQSHVSVTGFFHLCGIRRAIYPADVMSFIPLLLLW
jgi:hypothetical protein